MSCPSSPAGSFGSKYWTGFVGCERPDLKARAAGGLGTSGSRHRLLGSSPAQSGKGRGRTVSGKPEKRVCASVWAGVSSPWPGREETGQGGKRGEKGKKARGKKWGEERARAPPFPLQGQFSFAAGLTTGCLSICLNANIRNILFGCS